MKTLCITPVKHLAKAKSRLAGSLGPRARRELVLGLLEKTLRTLVACVSQGEVLIVGRDPEVSSLARQQGIWFLPEKGSGLNRALDQASSWAAKNRFSAILVVPLDLPFLEPETIKTILALGREPARMVIAADQSREGTNLLLINPAHGFRFCFGPGSYQRHLDESCRMGMEAIAYDSLATSFDLDDYQAYRFWQRNKHNPVRARQVSVQPLSVNPEACRPVDSLSPHQYQ